MGLINTVDARALFTKKLVSVYKERTTPTAFLRSFFTVKESNSKELSIEVQRGTEKIAVDVMRGTEGNRNAFSKSSEKIFVPPYYREYFDATELDFYDRLFTENGTVDEVTFSEWVNTVIEKLQMLQDKIERSYELQCSQVLETGIVTLVNGTNIDFKRKAASLVAYNAAHDFSINTVDPATVLAAGATFIRTKGKSNGNIFNVIMGADAFNAMINNTLFRSRADIKNISLDVIREPQRNAVGGVLHGEISGGAYKFRIWTYPEYYDTASVANNAYCHVDKVIIVPDSPKFVMGFAAVPRLMGTTENVGAGIAGQRGAYLIGEYLDQRNSSHIIDIKSAGLAIPVAVDQIYTVTVLN